MSKVIYISPFIVFPPTNGGGRYIFNYLKSSVKEHTVIFIGLKTQTRLPIEKIEKQYKLFSNNATKYFNIFDYAKLYRIIKSEKPSKIIVAMPYQSFFVIGISKLLKIPSYIHEQNIEFLRFKRLKKWWWPLLYIYEAVSYKLVDKILCISQNDMDNAVKFFHIARQKLHYTPYEVDTAIFKEDKRAGEMVRKKLKLEKNPLVLFFGPLDYKPNQEALEFIYNSLAPALYTINKQIKILLVGKNPPQNMNFHNLIYTGMVEKIEDYINASNLVIVPIRSGGGIRTKILESLSCNKKVLTTTIGAEGIQGKDYKDKLYVCDTDDKFTKQVSQLLKHD